MKCTLILSSVTNLNSIFTPQGLDCDAETEVVFREVPRGQEIKVEENISDPPLVTHSCQSRQRTGLQPQHQHDIRTVLVKQETSLSLNDAQTAQGSRHIRWNVEQINTDNTSGPGKYWDNFR